MESTKIAWITPTSGRKDLLFESRTSWYNNLVGNIEKEIIVDDSGSLDYNSWLKTEYPSADIVKCSDKNVGFTQAMRTCFQQAVESGCDYILHTEDDFILNIKLEVKRLIDILENNKDLSQIVLKRQVWFQGEMSAGDLIKYYKINDPSFEYRNDPELIFVNNYYWTTNPSLYPIKIAELGWPSEKNSEPIFTKTVMNLGYKSAFLGDEFLDPTVTHIGKYRVGYGY